MYFTVLVMLLNVLWSIVNGQFAKLVNFYKQ